MPGNVHMCTCHVCVWVIHVSTYMCVGITCEGVCGSYTSARVYMHNCHVCVWVIRVSTCVCMCVYVCMCASLVREDVCVCACVSMCVGEFYR